MPIAFLYFLEVVVLGRWFRWGFVQWITMFCLCTHSLQFNPCYRVHAVKRAKKKLPIQTFAKVCSVLLRALHNGGPLRAFPYFRRCAPGKNLNVTEYFVYLYYGACFWVFVHDGMTLRILNTVSSISGIQALGRPPSWCTSKFTAKWRPQKPLSFKSLNPIKTGCLHCFECTN
jgi:hypothetical protein